MTLKELQEMLERVNTMGFKPEEVEVNFKYTFTELKLNKAKAEVRADKEVKPILTIELG